MKNLNLVMLFAAIVNLFVILYGGEKNTQKNPVGFMAFFCVGILLPVAGIIAILS